jgi:hypothetical protein
MIRALVFATTLAAALAAGPVFATEAGPHGGPMEEVDPLHVELVAADGQLTIYVYDHSEKPVDASKAVASATVLVDKKPLRVALASAGSNVLKGTGAFKKGGDLVVVVSITMPQQPAVQARFTVK